MVERDAGHEDDLDERGSSLLGVKSGSETCTRQSADV